ncbi:hypothetical protein [Gorillibacterium sp. sgz5001074]|uniref:YfjL-like protein n=1 Tax=Gorillibacterium sp. sgz5001074 TaxID=3446695 RepID=UPI003F66312A
MQKTGIALAAAAVLAFFLFTGYSAVRTLNGNPLSTSKAVKIAEDYLRQEYAGQSLHAGNATYLVTYGRFEIPVLDADDREVNRLLLRKGLKSVEDTVRSKELEQQMKIYLLTQSIRPFEKVEAIVSVLYSVREDYRREDSIWLTLTGKPMDHEELAAFGRIVVERTRAFGGQPDRFRLDYGTGIGSRSRLLVTGPQLDAPSYVPYIGPAD